MRKKLKMQLPEGWEDQTRQLESDVPTYVRPAGKDPGALQVSVFPYQEGPVPHPSTEDLRGLALQSGEKHQLGKLIGSSSGTCRLGKFGTAIFASADTSRSQIWWMSNGSDFVVVTHLSCGDPDPAEVAEAALIVSKLELG